MLMSDFWNYKFKEVKTMWGMDPSDSAFIAKDFFIDHQIHEVLILGVGYGRNAFKIIMIKCQKTTEPGIIQMVKPHEGLAKTNTQYPKPKKPHVSLHAQINKLMS